MESDYERLENDISKLIDDASIAQFGRHCDEFYHSPIGRFVRARALKDYTDYVQADLRAAEMPGDTELAQKLDQARQNALTSRRAMGWLLAAINDGRLAEQNEKLNQEMG